jgi:subtilisin family serine protease
MSSPISHLLASLVLALLAGSTAVAQSTLPSLETQSAIQSLPMEPRSLTRNRGGASPESAFREYKADPSKLPPSAREGVKLDDQGQANVPVLVPNTMIIQFQPNASKDSIDSLLKNRKLKVLETFPKLGAVKVEADLSKYFAPDLSDDSANQALLRGVTRVIEDFGKEPVVRSATPDVVLRSEAADVEVRNLMNPSEVGGLALAENKEAVDWGIGNIEADKLWELPGARDGVLFGIMDVGFARHDDITFLELPKKTEIADHGNHVAGIACGRHGNGVGIRGVLPNCFVRARTGNVFFQSIEGGQVSQFFVIFSQILATFDAFIGQYDDIHTVNLSMGYNWRRNFAINPDLPESSQWRGLVEAQGVMLVTALELADKAGKVIFSAAGNDSSGLPKPVGAKYASPFNWAALTAREKGIARNGIVVEAHDASNKRASFSNVGGHISCPGVDVLSAVAHDSGGNPSSSSYGKMSGTSMASPYCASAHALLSLVRPGYSGSEITDCLLASTEKSDTGAPIPKLTQALAKCPAR